MAISTTHWNPTHPHPRGSWWQLPNDPRQAKLIMAGLGVFDLLFAALIIYLVLEHGG
jgi:hypothetical protein